MIQYPVRELCLWLTTVSSLAERYGRINGNQRLSEATNPKSLDEIKAALDRLIPIFQKCSLDASLNRAKRARLDVIRPSCVSVEILRNHLSSIEESASDELTKRMFMFVPSSKAKFYSSPKKQFPKSWQIFPNAHGDMASACKCYAIDQNSACVFHCIGLMQIGLTALAKRLHIAVNIYLDEWNDIITKIEGAVQRKRRLATGPNASRNMKSRWRKIEPFYSEVISDLRAVKDAWRNPTAHFRRSYDEAEAKKVLSKVGDFMENLSKQLQERRPSAKKKSANP